MNHLTKPQSGDALLSFCISYRVNNPFTCARCHETVKHYYFSKQKFFRCSKCRHKTTYKSGTLFQSSKLSFDQWYLALKLMSDPRKSISAKEMQKLLEIKNYRTVLELMHKIRNSMAQHELKMLKKEMGRFRRVRCKMNLRKKSENKKKHNLLIYNEKSEEGSYRISMYTVEDMKKYSPTRCARKGMARTAELSRRESNGHARMSFDEVTYWVRTHYDNFEKNMKGVYHGISSKYRQLYLAEFCFRTNQSMAGEDVMMVLLTQALERPWWS